MILIFGLILIIEAQVTSFDEYITIAPGSFLQLTSLVVPDGNNDINPGNLYATLNLSYYPNTFQKNSTFNIYIFPISDVSYTCVMNKLILQSSTADCMTNPIQCSQVSTFDLQRSVNRPTVFQNCLQNDSQNDIQLQLYNQSLQNYNHTQYIIVVENQERNSISLRLKYNVTVAPSNKFYELVLGLCIGLGILVIILTSVLCIFNYKYQKVKEQNVTYNLVRGESNYKTTKSENKNK